MILGAPRNMKGVKIVGFPVCIESNKYERNKLLFNLAFAFDPDVDTGPYEPVCRKLAHYIRELEVCTCFVSGKAWVSLSAKPMMCIFT